MKIVTGRVMAEIDQIAIEERKIPSLGLMENAGRATAWHFHHLCGNPQASVVVLCGKGNNGGDGLVAARYLLGRGYRPRVVLTHPPEELSPDSQTNFHRFRVLPFARWNLWNEDGISEWWRDDPIVIDSLLGTGFKGVPRPPYDAIIRQANAGSRWSMGVDIASGVDSETGEVAGEAIGCRSTLTFGLPMVGHFRGRGIDFTGSLSIADIGFPKDLLSRANSEAVLITHDWAEGHLPRYRRSVHKTLRGKVLIVAGSARMLGAALLVAQAAVKTGAGLTTLALPESLNASIKGSLPEVMTLPLPETKQGEISNEATEILLSFAESVDAVGIGPGLGRGESVRDVVRSLVEKTPKPLVLDADGLYALSDNAGQDLIRNRKLSTVLTPHAGEFLRLSGTHTATDLEENPWKAAAELSERLKSTVLLKGPATVIADPGSPLFINRSGHPAMSQGGMGDVLTGIITTFLGEGLPGLQAAGLGAYVHGRAGERAYHQSGSRTVSASEVMDHLSRVFRGFEKVLSKPENRA